MSIELSERVQSVLEQRAMAAGMTTATYANALLEEQLLEDSVNHARRVEQIDRWMESMTTSTASSGRSGRGWRDYIHEGHQD